MIEKTIEALSREVDEAEIFSLKASTNTVGIKKGSVDLFKENSSFGFGIRVIRDKKAGFYFCNSLARDAIEKAIKISKLAQEDEYSTLPQRQDYRDIGGYDKRIEDIDSEQALEFVDALIRPCKEYKVTPTSGVISWGESEVRILNTNGVEGFDRGTVISGFLSTVAKAGDVSSGFHFDVSRELDLDFQGIGKEASRLARDSLNAEKIGTRKIAVTLLPLAVSELLGNVLIPSFSADNVQRNRSFLADKLGEKIFSESLDIVDDGTLDKGLETAKFDSEGVRSQKTQLVKDGVLKGYLYDTYTANKGSSESTGNASRESYSTLPQVGPSNFIVSGKGGLSNEGLVVHGLIGAHTSNPISGDFSVETRNAFLEGKPVRKAILSGNIFELLNKVVGFGEDYRQVSSVRTPSIEFEEVQVSG
ncbi:MAG: TldD/PmbA family protein [Candidatus Hydrothermarchaeales archaeon]